MGKKGCGVPYKLTEKIVLEIRAQFTGARGEIPALAKKYNLSAVHTRRVCRGIIWKHLPFRNVHDIKTAVRQDWRKIPGFPKYLVNSVGEIWFLGNLNKPYPQHSRLIQSTAIRDSHNRIRYMPRAVLVLLAFKGPSKLKNPQARHLDDNRKNNDLSNLAWGTHQDNYDDAVRNGISGPGSPCAKARGNALRGRPRPAKVRAKISKTKRDHPERQYYSHQRSPTTGRFIPGASR